MSGSTQFATTPTDFRPIAALTQYLKFNAHFGANPTYPTFILPFSSHGGSSARARGAAYRILR